MRKEEEKKITGLIYEGDEFLVKLGENFLGRLRILADPCPDNPREFSECATKMYSWHGRYRLGDKHFYSSPSDFLEDMVSKHISEERLKDKVEDLSIREMIQLLEDNEDFIYLPIFMYEHSGVSISTFPYSDRWDSGQVGWISIDKKTAFENFNVTEDNWKEKCKKIMESEIEEYDEYLNGNVYGYKLYAADEEETPNSEIEVAWNFYGDRYEDSCILDDFKVLKQIA